MGDNLKPCPFCGQPAHINHMYGEVSCSLGLSGQEYQIELGKHCGNDGIYTVDEWNSRPREDELLRELEIKYKNKMFYSSYMGISAENRFWSWVDKNGENGCWNWTGGFGRGGYSQIKINGRVQYVHRVSWSLVHGEIPNGLFVCHKCDNPKCVNPEHLFLGTQLDNMRDRDNKGRGSTVPKGTYNGSSKLDWDKVRTIRENYVYKKVPASKFAKEYGVAEETILKVVHNRTWID